MSGDYVSLYINSLLYKQGPNAFISLAVLCVARLFPIIAMAPFFGAKVLPHSVKVILGLSLFAIFLPQLTNSLTTTIDFNLQLLLYFAKELFIGSILGFLVSLPFIIVQNAGILIDHQRGGASLMVNDPAMQNQSSPLGTLFNYVLIYLFFLMNGPFTVIEIIGKSYEIIPPDQFLSHTFFSSRHQFWIDMTQMFGKIMKLSIQLATPALIIILMTDLFLGIANRLAPQVQITFLGMPLKSLLALAIVFLGWQLFNEQVVKETYDWLKYLSHFVELLARTD